MIICNNYNKIRNKYVAYYVCNVKQFILQPVNLLRKLFQNFKNDLSTFLNFGEYIKIALIIICENIMMIHVFSSNNSN